MKILVLVCYIIIGLLNIANVRRDCRLIFFMLLTAISGIGLGALYTINGPRNMPLGPFQSTFSYTLPLIYSFFLMLRGKEMELHQYVTPIILLSLFFVVNIYNPENRYPQACIPLIGNVIPIFIFGILLSKNYPAEDLIYSIYEVIKCITLFEFVLVICYPILGFKSLTTVFYGDLGATSSVKRAGYVSAVGSYIHPAGLACSSALFCIFNLGIYLYGKNKKSIVLVLINLFIIYFTFSRMTFVALSISSVVLVFCIKYIRVSFKMAISLCLVFILMYLVTLIPVINDLFFKSDADDMVEARMVHWNIAFSIFEKYTFLGCGINTHNYIMTNYFSEFNSFITSNPIHNVHLIVLAETGLVGIVFWITSFIYLIVRSLNIAYSSNGIRHLSCTICVSFLLFMFIYSFTGWSFLQMPIYTPLILITTILYNIRQPLNYSKIY